MRPSSTQRVPALTAIRWMRPAVRLAMLAMAVQLLLPVQALLAAARLNTGWDSVCLADPSHRDGPGGPGQAAPGPTVCPVCSAAAAAVGAPPPATGGLSVPAASVAIVTGARDSSAAPAAAACRLPPPRAPPAA